VINLFAPPPEPSLEATTRVKSWVREHLQLPDEVTVLVTELRCQEAGCPDLETVVAVLGAPGRPRQFKVFKPVAEVTQADVQQGLTTGFTPEGSAS